MAEDHVDVLLYSDDATTRRTIMDAVGRRAAADLPLVRWDETATPAAVVEKASAGGYGLLVLDGEAAKEGGMSLSRRLHQEVFDLAPILVLTARPQDSWLADWSLAEGQISAPYDPMEVATAVAGLLRGER